MAEGKTGRPKVEIDWDTVDKLCAIHCTHTEIAEVVGCHPDTLNNHSKKLHGITFSEYIKQRRERGKASLRRKMWQHVENGNIVMAIFLAKNWLGMADKVDQKTDLSLSVKPVILPDNGRS